jgi:hypothetical protein
MEEEINPPEKIFEGEDRIFSDEIHGAFIALSKEMPSGVISWLKRMRPASFKKIEAIEDEMTEAWNALDLKWLRATLFDYVAAWKRAFSEFEETR